MSNARVSTVQARDQFADVVNRVAYGKERLVLTRRGKALVAVVPFEDVQLLEALEDQLDIEEARAVLAEIGETGTVSWESLKAELCL